MFDFVNNYYAYHEPKVDQMTHLEYKDSCLEIIFGNNIINQYWGESETELNMKFVGVMNSIIDETLANAKKYITKKNPALIKVFGEMLSVIGPKKWEKKKVAMISRLSFLKRRILTSIEFINSGDAILSEFEELVGVIASESQKDDYKEHCDYNDTSQRVKGFYKYLDLFVVNNDRFDHFLNILNVYVW